MTLEGREGEDGSWGQGFRGVVIATWVVAAVGCRNILGLQDPVCTDCALETSTEPNLPDGGKRPGGSDASLPAVSCDSYCKLVRGKCTGSVQQYQTDGSVCFSMCPYFSQAALECRNEYAQLAGLDDNVSECSAAGPSGQISRAAGSKQCESACDAYCSLMLGICSDKYEQTFGKGDAGADNCHTVCNGLNNADAYNAASDPHDNSVQCRLYHLGLRLQTGIETHCEHAAGEGAFCVAPAPAL